MLLVYLYTIRSVLSTMAGHKLQDVSTWQIVWYLCQTLSTAIILTWQLTLHRQTHAAAVEAASTAILACF